MVAKLRKVVSTWVPADLAEGHPPSMAPPSTSSSRLQKFLGFVATVLMVGVLARHPTYLWREQQQQPWPRATTVVTTGQSQLRKGGHSPYSNHSGEQEFCRFYLAESAIPRGGLGLFTAIDLKPGQEAQSMPDICIYVADTPSRTDFQTHSWARDVFMGQFEGRNPRGACEGFATLFNSMPPGVATSKLVSMKRHSNAGLVRHRDPGAGAVTQYHGISSKADRFVLAGSELTIDYGDWKYDKKKTYTAPSRSVSFLQKYGYCIDNIVIQPATGRAMGRGAFARRGIAAGDVVAPAPLQTFRNRSDFARQEPEALFVNYCFQPANSSLLLFPYGPGVNLINHNLHEPNVAVRWSQKTTMSHNAWLDLPLEQFWDMVYPGGLILEVYALRDIVAGEELYMNYGTAWDQAWQRHVAAWQPPTDMSYVYPEDMDLTKPFRTVSEQADDPYSPNLATVCWTPNWNRERGKRMKWSMPKYEWPEGLTYCHILKRSRDTISQDFVYEVELSFSWSSPRPYDPAKSDRRRNIDYNVPHAAIMFVDKPYTSDLHLKNAFRHPILLPDEIVPKSWALQ